MDAVAAFLYDIANFVKSVFRTIVCFQGAARSKTRPNHYKYDCPEEILVLGIERAVDEYVTSCCAHSGSNLIIFPQPGYRAANFLGGEVA
jgi:hypothetical protein